MFAYPYQVRTKLKTWLPIEIRNENLIHYLNDENNEIENIIDKIFNLPIVTFEKIEVIETLSKIKHSYFIEKLRKENNSDIIYDGLLYRAIYEYIQWICILDKHVNFQTINKEKFRITSYNVCYTKLLRVIPARRDWRENCHKGAQRRLAIFMTKGIIRLKQLLDTFAY